jgi:hypothetical protein
MPAPATADPIARTADLLLGNQALGVLSRTLAMLDAPARCLVYRYGALGEPASTVAGVLGVTTKALYGRWDRLRARLTRALPSGSSGPSICACCGVTAFLTDRGCAGTQQGEEREPRGWMRRAHRPPAPWSPVPVRSTPFGARHLINPRARAHVVQ